MSPGGNIYLVGFMGAGKSSVGRVLARALRRAFVDMDEQLTTRLGMSPAEVFATAGEQRFRSEESRLLKALARRRGLVVATGGGVVEDPGNLRLMRRSGVVVHLKAALESCAARVAGGLDRPLWPRAPELFARRQGLYAQAQVEVDAEAGGVEEVARAVAEALGGWQGELEAQGQRSALMVSFKAPAAVAKLVGNRAVVLLSDRGLARGAARAYMQELRPRAVVVVPEGERAKGWWWCRQVCRRMLEAGVGRDWVLVGVGGGALTDLAGFVGAVFKRGMAVVLAATTLVGGVDAAVGGKCALDLGGVKNVIGLVRQPEAVVGDAWAWASLPPRRIKEGVVEAYKTALVAEREFAEWVERHLGLLKQGEGLALAELAARAMAAKALVVQADPEDMGHRQVLNLGHTYAHALEAASGWRLSHARAVAAGLVVAAAISARRGMLPLADARRIAATAKALGAEGLVHPGIQRLWPLMQADKKARGGRVRYVLLEDVGKAVVVEDITPAEVEEAARRWLG